MLSYNPGRAPDGQLGPPECHVEQALQSAFLPTA